MRKGFLPELDSIDEVSKKKRVAELPFFLRFQAIDIMRQITPNESLAGKCFGRVAVLRGGCGSAPDGGDDWLPAACGTVDKVPAAADPASPAGLEIATTAPTWCSIAHWRVAFSVDSISHQRLSRSSQWVHKRKRLVFRQRSNSC
ncbi:MAG: hypothetical protein IAE88_15535 [Rhodobacteraceae bacterium]|uniref:hypothetical protein n=1 Tax=Accumulibacter sp. TaxID=2053492 RepID=UPI0019E42427|nr:hypothetical protein [Accumulibacter sp.]MBE2260273.1 hypothetical protein [Paracoccaceae bacterium]MCB1942595.1 hypothetical protein [Accumulibacter sp.]